MHVVYVAGPYRAATIRGVVENIRAAESVALQLWQAGFAVICPHTNAALLDGAISDEAVLAGDLAILARCDLVVLIPGWQNSTGAKGEAAHARELGIPVECWPDDKTETDAEYMCEMFHAFRQAIDYAPRRRKEYAEANAQ